jgi:hypothetical protein
MSTARPVQQQIREETSLRTTLRTTTSLLSSATISIALNGTLRISLWGETPYPFSRRYGVLSISGATYNTRFSGLIDALPTPRSSLALCKTTKSLLMFYTLTSMYLTRLGSRRFDLGTTTVTPCSTDGAAGRTA